jgi:Spy/CpxP family protein refolding chaperone
MKRTIGLFALALPLALGAAAWAAADKTTPPKRGDGQDAVQACANMMQGPAETEHYKKGMRDFMHFDRAPETMTKMMAMARRMGDGDVMLGMTRMMEVIGGQGGMMTPGDEDH